MARLAVPVRKEVTGKITNARSFGPGWGALIVVYIVWGSTYLAIRVAVESIPPLLMAGGRYLIAGIILLPIVARSPERSSPGSDPSSLPRHRVRRFFRIAAPAELAGCVVVGVLMLTGGNGGVSWGEHSVPSGLAALLVASVPLWMVIGDRVMTRAVPSLITLVALGIGLVGVLVLARPGAHHGSALGIAVILCASLSWATGSLLGRRVPQPKEPLVATAYQMLVGGLALAILAVATGEFAHFDVGSVTLRAWLALAWLIGPGSILGFSCYMTALRHLPTSTVSTYAYVNPMIAVALGWALLHEVVSPSTLFGGALVVLAVALVLTDQRRHSFPERRIDPSP
jgi:drug/metabolite transporter (DMT)-like permease